MRRVLLIFVTGLFLSCCVGCKSDPSELNETTIMSALKGYYKEHPECIGIDEELPVKIDKNSIIKKSDKKRLDGFVDAGLLQRNQKTVERNKLGLNEGNEPETKEVPVYEYTITERGKQAITTQTNPITGEEHAFCYGNWHVQKIQNYTEPADTLGKTVSNVKFVRKIEDPADWTEKLSKKPTGLKAQEHEVTLVLTGDGWVHQNVMN